MSETLKGINFSKIVWYVEMAAVTVPEETRQTATAMKQEQKQKTASEMGPQIGVTIIFRIILSNGF